MDNQDKADVDFFMNEFHKLDRWTSGVPEKKEIVPPEIYVSRLGHIYMTYKSNDQGENDERSVANQAQ